MYVSMQGTSSVLSFMETSRNNTCHKFTRIRPRDQGIVAVVGNFKARVDIIHTCTFVFFRVEWSGGDRAVLVGIL